MKIVKSSRAEASPVALWTPWGIEQPAEREAQKAAIRRVIRRLAEMRKRDKARPVAQ